MLVNKWILKKFRSTPLILTFPPKGRRNKAIIESMGNWIVATGALDPTGQRLKVARHSRWQKTRICVVIEPGNLTMVLLARRQSLA